MAEHPSSHTKGTRRRRNGHRLPGLDSFQGLYLTLASVLVALLLGGGWLWYHYVVEATSWQISNLESRTQLEHRFFQSALQLWRVNEWLQHQLVEPGIRQPVTLDSRINEFVGTLPPADEFPPHSSMHALLKRMREEEVPELTKLAHRFLQISLDNSRRFPATTIMESRMQGNATSFFDTVNEVIDELSANSGLNADELKILFAAYRLRDIWQKILGEFRLLVANRFGVFADDPSSGMQARARNIALYFEGLRNQLRALQSLPLPPDAFFLEAGTWKALEQTADRWEKGYHEVLNALSSDSWRKDLEFYKSAINPHLIALQKELNQLQETLSNEYATDLQRLNLTAQRLSLGLLAVTLLVALAILAAYFYLHNRIIRPISETTRALRHEAMGLHSNPVRLPKTRETRELVNAFAEMRREVRRRQQGLDHLAHHDPLTQLPNRALFKDRLEHAVNLAKRNNQAVALLFLDLDNFKQINDTLGHLAGDELLVIVGRRLRELLRHTDTVARFGGDEFAILLENVEGKRQARNIASKILDELSQPITLAGQEFHLTASLGIAMAPYDDSQPDNLIRDADTAMYEAKRRGKNAYSFFSSELLQRATSQLNLEREIRAALERNEFIFHFQPIVHTENKKIYGVEALLRWKSNKDQLRYPGEFMETLLAMDPHQSFMENLLLQVDKLQTRCLEELQIPLRVSINMSASVLRSANRHSQILNTLRQRAHPQLLHIEITEDTLLEDLANARVLLTEIKRLGIPLILDDFGTGQSSLNHLRSFPFDAIKIDREFVMNMDQKQDDITLVRAITQLAHSFNMKVVAEGVEKESQYRFLEKIGCDYLQGYYVGKPVSAARLFAQLEHLRKLAQAAG